MSATRIAHLIARARFDVEREQIMSRWYSPSDFDDMEDRGDPVPRQSRSERHTVPSRPCELCAKTAWLKSTSPEGVQEFMCGNGHQAFVAPPAPLRTECAWCTPRHLIREGAEPTSSGMCDKAKLLMLAKADQTHHPTKGTR